VTDEYVPAGPACDFCTEWPAVGTLMNLADYQTQKFCASCGPKFLLGIVEAMTGAMPDAPDEDECPACGGMVPITDMPGHLQAHADAADGAGDPAAVIAAAIKSGETVIVDDDEPGSAADHWSSAQHVVKSTHGHRAARKPAGGEQ
jgi:hypothetical protein